MPEGFDELQRRAEGALIAEREKARLETVRRARVATGDLLVRCQQAQSAAKVADARRDAALFWNAAERRLAEGQTALAGEDHASAGKHFTEALGLYQRAEGVAREARTATAARRVEDLLGEAERLLGAGCFAECLSRIQEISRLVPGHTAAGGLRARAEEGLRQAEGTRLASPPSVRDGEGVRGARRPDETVDAAPAPVAAEVPAPSQGEVPAAVLAHTAFALSGSATTETRGAGSAVLLEAPAAINEKAEPAPVRERTASTAALWLPRTTRTPVVVGIAVALAVVVVVGGYLLLGPGAQPEKAPAREASTPVGKPSASAPSDGAKALIEKARQVAATNPQEAESLLRQAIKMDAKSVQASFQLGLLYARQKEYTKAIDAYVQAADLDPKFPDAVFNLAHVYAMTSEYQKAAEMYAWVVTLEPPYVDEALYNLAIVQEKQGKRQDAIQSHERAIRVNPNNKPAERFLSSLKRKR
jgi:tetratricopeptide (TPR) repeat protein